MTKIASRGSCLNFFAEKYKLIRNVTLNSLQKITNLFSWESNQQFQRQLVGKPVQSTALLSCHLAKPMTSALFQGFPNTDKSDSLSRTESKNSTRTTDLQCSHISPATRSMLHLQTVDYENLACLAPTAWTFTTASTCPGTAWWTPTICVHANEVSSSWLWNLHSRSILMNRIDQLKQWLECFVLNDLQLRYFLKRLSCEYVPVEFQMTFQNKRRAEKCLGLMKSAKHLVWPWTRLAVFTCKTSGLEELSSLELFLPEFVQTWSVLSKVRKLLVKRPCAVEIKQSLRYD